MAAGATPTCPAMSVLVTLCTAVLDLVVGALLDFAVAEGACAAGALAVGPALTAPDVPCTAAFALACTLDFAASTDWAGALLACPVLAVLSSRAAVGSCSAGLLAWTLSGSVAGLPMTARAGLGEACATALLETPGCLETGVASARLAFIAELRLMLQFQAGLPAMLLAELNLLSQ